MLPAFLINLRKFIRVAFYFSWLCPVWLTLFYTVISLRGPAMIVYDVKTKVLDTEIFPQHTIANLNLWHYIYCFFFSQEKPLRWKEINTHLYTHTHTHTHTHIHAHTYTYTVKNTEDSKGSEKRSFSF